jgi:hypothetical protein
MMKTTSHNKIILLIVFVLITRYHMIRLVLGLWCLMVNAIVNNISVISCRSDLLVGET